MIKSYKNINFNQKKSLKTEKISLRWFIQSLDLCIYELYIRSLNEISWIYGIFIYTSWDSKSSLDTSLWQRFLVDFLFFSPSLLFWQKIWRKKAHNFENIKKFSKSQKNNIHYLIEVQFFLYMIKNIVFPV